MSTARALLLTPALCSLAACADYGSTPIDPPRDAALVDVARDARADVTPDAPVLDATTIDDAPATADSPAVDATTSDAVAAAPARVTRRDVAITPVGSVRQPAVAHHGGADAFVTAYTWVIPDAPTPRFRIEARAITLGPDGTPIPSAPVTVDGDTVRHDAGDPAIAAPDVAGAPALVVWIDDRADPGGRTSIEVYGRFVRVTGGASPRAELAGDPFVISQHPGSNEYLPAVAWDAAAGMFLVAWADDRERGARDEDARVVYARLVSPDGHVGPEQRVGDGVLFQTNPTVASCGDGRFLVGWADYRREGAVLVSQARGRVLDARTAATVGAIQLWGEARDHPQDLTPTQCAPDRDGWIVAWGVAGPPSLRQLRVGRLNPDGSLRGAPWAASAQPDGARAASLAVLPATGQTVATFLAQDSTAGYVVALAPGATSLAGPTQLTPTQPRLGTFWAAVAASARRPEALAVMTLDYDRLHATSLTAVP